MKTSFTLRKNDFCPLFQSKKAKLGTFSQSAQDSRGRWGFIPLIRGKANLLGRFYGNAVTTLILSIPCMPTYPVKLHAMLLAQNKET